MKITLSYGTNMNKARTAGFILITMLLATPAVGELRITIKTMVAKPTTLTKRLISIGTVESRSITYIQTAIAGRITSLKCKVGDLIKKNEIVATLNPTISADTLTEAKAQYDSYQGLYHAAQKDVATAKKLVAAKAMTLDDLEKLQVKLREAKSAYTVSKAQLSKATFAYQHNTIRAKMDGIVQQVKVTVGSIVPAGEPLCLVADTDHLKAILPFPQNLRNKIHINQKVKLTSEAANNSIKTTIAHIAPMISPVNRSFNVIVNFNNQNQQWHPGASVTGYIYQNKTIQAFLIPEISIITQHGGEYVYTVQKGRAALLKVKTAGFHDFSTMIVTQGLKPGDVVVTYGAGFLSQGMPVKEAQ